MAFNFNVSAGMIQVTIPYVGPSEQYRFSLAVADGDGQDIYTSDPFTIQEAA
ncbi:hypothetical protein ACG7TL_003280 [Trametes sanguinea]